MQTIPLRAAITLLVLLLCGATALRAADELLAPEKAFRLDARALDERSVEVIFSVAAGYYLYGEQFKFAAPSATLGAAITPRGEKKFDETFQKIVETHRGLVTITLPVRQAPSDFRLFVTNQGCADRGVCYPPMTRELVVSLAGFGGNSSVHAVPAGLLGSAETGDASAARDASNQVQDEIVGALHSGRWWTVVGVFLVAGLLLSFTPCVLPMLPILSSLIVGQGVPVSRWRGFALAASYCIGMAMAYTALGVAAGLAGEGFAATLQKPWVLGGFALGLLLLAASMFGMYELQLPDFLSRHLHRASQHMPAGRFAGVFAMGAVSALLVSPCVVAPLAGALLYLSQTRDVLLGGTALFSLAAGMSVPLLILGASEGALLPRAGPWMIDVKSFFGLLLIGVAIWTIQPVFPPAVALFLWGLLLFGSAKWALGLGAGNTKSWWRVTVAAVLGLLGVLQFVGAASGGSDPLQPLAHLRTDSKPFALRFSRVLDANELNARLSSAKRSVMLDFYADWCVSCKEMERYTFSDPEVQQKLAGALLLQVDVTQNTARDRELLKRFNLFGPPAIIFFDAEGREISATRVIGFQNARRFGKTLQEAGL